MVLSAFVVLISIIVIFGSFGFIEAGERGVKTRFGEVVGTYEPGAYFKVPLTERMNVMDVRTQTVVYELEDPLFAASKDQQDVKVATVVNYHIDPTAVAHIYQQYGRLKDYEKDVIRPAVRDSIKAAASQYTAEEMTTKRPEYSDSAHKLLADRLKDFNIVVERVNITNIEFSPEYTASIEAKVTTEQKALQAQNDLARVEFEAKQRIEQAKAEAEAIRIQAEAVTQQGGADYVKLQAINKWNGNVPTTMIPDAALPFLGKI